MTGVTGPVIARKRPGDPILADDYNKVLDELTRLARWRVAAPLAFHSDRGGQSLGLSAPFDQSFPVQVTGPLGAGNYTGVRGRWNHDRLFDPSQSFSMADVADFTDGVDCYLFNQAEHEIATHRIGAGVIVIGHPTDLPTADGKPVLGTNYSHAIRWIRFNADAGAIEVSYFDAATVDDVPGASWVPAIQFDACDSGGGGASPAAASMSDGLLAAVEAVVADPAMSAPEHLEVAWLIAQQLDEIRLYLKNNT